MFWTIFIIICIFLFVILSFFQTNSDFKDRHFKVSKLLLFAVVILSLLFCESVLSEEITILSNNLKDKMNLFSFFAPPYVDGLEIVCNTGEMQMDVGASKKVNCSISPAEASDYKLVWESSNSSVVSVDKKGVMTAKSIGAAEITVRFKHFPDLPAKDFNVYVVAPNDYSTLGNIVTFSEYIKLTGKDNEYMIYFDILKDFDLEITDTKVEVYDFNGVMVDTSSYTPGSPLSNFIGTFKLTPGQLYITIGYITTTNGCTYKSNCAFVHPES